MNISNREFWNYWKKGEYEKALSCNVEEEQKQENRLQNMLFENPEQLKRTGAIVTISVGEFIYDYVMINPSVVKGIDFARTEDLSSLFTLNQFSSGIDTSVITGDIAQLQGYVAEQMIAAELQAKGHEVEFPQTSNNPGWDLLIDGQPFQVKSLADPQGVRGHLNKYPDIPVYVNEELAPHFEGNPNVYISNTSREDVLEATSSTLSHAGNLLDFEIPWIAAGVSSVSNIKRVWKDEVLINHAVFNVMSDTSSRVMLGALGQKAGIVFGTMIFGPAGGVTGAMLGAYMGTSQGGRLSTGIKRTFYKKHEYELVENMNELLLKVITQIDAKILIKKKKIDDIKRELIDSDANSKVKAEIDRQFHKEKAYLINKKEELIAITLALKNKSVSILDILSNTMATIVKTKVHPVHYQNELKLLQQKSSNYLKKI